ncbi:MAG: hypothetical protein ABR555_00445 [Pyrinomonadaceae bacterium]
MLRETAILLLLLISASVVVPFADPMAHGLRQSVSVAQRHHRRHSRAWWRRHRARLRKRRAAAMAHRNALLSGTTLPLNVSVMAPVSNTVATQNSLTVPNAATTYTKVTPNAVGSLLPGQMSLSVVALSRPNPAFLTAREQSKMLAGVELSELRRVVIDKMIVSGGWVTNDFVREINGSRVFVVTAQTPRDVRGPAQTWNFYFTEVSGRVYSLTTNAPVDSAERMANEAERFLSSLQSNNQSVNK